MPDQPAQQASTSGWPHLVAGGVAGSSAVLLLHPFDVIKTRLQVQDGCQGHSSTYRSALHAARTMYAAEGWRAFYQGMVPAWVGSGVAWASYFYVYERIKLFYLRWLQRDQLPALWYTLSAAQAGALVCLMTNPLWLIKTRLQLQQNLTAAQLISTTSTAAARAAAATAASSSLPAAAAAAAAQGPAHHYRGFLDALIQIGRREGLRGYYKGLAPSLVLQTSHGAVQFTVYEELKRAAAHLHRWRSGQGKHSISSAETSVYAIVSKLAASVVTYPTQVVRSRLQQRFDNRTLVYRSTAEVVRMTWQREGLRGFYKGLAPALLRVMPQSALTFVVYENTLKLLNAETNS